MQRPLCFVLMPFGSKPDGNGGVIDFDTMDRQIFKPAIEAAELEAIRADEEMGDGIIHKPMFVLQQVIDEHDRDLIASNLGNALAAVREPWEPKTTARNLRLISEARARRGEDTGEVEEVIRELER